MKFKGLFSIISALVFICGIIVYGSSALISSQSRDSRTKPFIRPFVVEFSHFAEGKSSVAPQVIIQKVSAFGKGKSFHLVRENSELKQIGELGVQYNQLQWEQFTSPEVLRSSPKFVREESLCGLKVYVLRTDQFAPEILESWFAVETGQVQLKTIIDDGKGSRIITEATKIDFREVKDNEVN